LATTTLVLFLGQKNPPTNLANMVSFKIAVALAAVLGTALSFDFFDQKSPNPNAPMHYQYQYLEPRPGPMPYPYPGSMDMCDFGEDQKPLREGGANDMVVVGQYNGEKRSTQFNVKLPRGRLYGTLKLYINGRMMPLQSKMAVTRGKSVYFSRPTHACTFTPMELSYMYLMPGINQAWLKVENPWRDMFRKDIVIPFNIYYYNETSRFVAFDLDNPMGRQDENRNVIPRYDMSQAINMLNRIYQNGYTPVYITSRPYTESRNLRYQLFGAPRNVYGFSLPMGPLFMAPRARGMTHTYKTMQLINLSHIFNEPRGVFYGAYGHASIDSDIYRNAGIMPSHTFLFDEQGRMFNMKTKEGTSYREQTEMVDVIYPKWDPYNPDVDPINPDPYNPDVDPINPDDPDNPDVDPIDPDNDPVNPDVPDNPDVQFVRSPKLFSNLMFQLASYKNYY